MGWNVPDDWGSYYTNCGLCGTKYHESEGGCCCTEDKTVCNGANCNDENDLDSYHEDVTEAGGRNYCEDCIECGFCGADEDVVLAFSEEADELLCPGCVLEAMADA